MGCCEDKVINQRTVAGADPGIIPEEIIDVLSNSIARIEYKLDIDDIVFSTGFFIKFMMKQKLLHFFFTCQHSIEEKVIQSEIEISLFSGKIKNEKVSKIKLDKKTRFIMTYQNLDVTIIEILPQDNILEDKFLLPDFNYINGTNDFINKQIYIGGYPSVNIHKNEKHFSSGIIKSVFKNNLNFLHSSDTREGSSGSPIINSDKKVIGIHNGAYDDLNYGTFIGPIITKLTKEENIEKINDNKPYENDNKEINDKEENDDIKKDDDENEQPKEDNNNNTFDQKSYYNNLINSTSPFFSLSQENATNFGILLNNPNYINYVKNYYSNPNVREMLENDQNFQNMLKINPAMKMMYDKPELIDKMFTQEICNDMSKALINNNKQEIIDVDQKITNTIIKEYNKKNNDDNN